MVADRAALSRHCCARLGSGKPARLGSSHRSELALLAASTRTSVCCEQNEASDWADIMPRSGYVLYTNALWYRVKRLFDLPGADATHASFNQLLFPFGRSRPDDRRGSSWLNTHAASARRRDLYLSFLNFSFWGEEGDTFGNLLAILFGLADATMTQRVLSALEREGVHDPYPARAVCEPIARHDTAMAPLHAIDISRTSTGSITTVGSGRSSVDSGSPRWPPAANAARARADLTQLAHANRLNQWEFNEWLHGRERVAERNAAPVVECWRLPDRASRLDPSRLRPHAIVISTERSPIRDRFLLRISYASRPPPFPPLRKVWCFQCPTRNRHDSTLIFQPIPVPPPKRFRSYWQ